MSLPVIVFGRYNFTRYKGSCLFFWHILPCSLLCFQVTISLLAPAKFEFFELKAFRGFKLPHHLSRNPIEMAAECLKKIINSTMQHSIVKFEIRTRQRTENPWLEPAMEIDDPIVFMWDFIRRDICGRGGKEWKFKQCKKCRLWIYAAAPGRRRTREHCDGCIEHDKKESSRERMKKFREKRASTVKRPVGRPRKK